MRIVSFIEEQEVIEAILSHLGLRLIRSSPSAKAYALPVCQYAADDMGRPIRDNALEAPGSGTGGQQDAAIIEAQLAGAPPGEDMIRHGIEAGRYLIRCVSFPSGPRLKKPPHPWTRA